MSTRSHIVIAALLLALLGPLSAAVGQPSTGPAVPSERARVPLADIAGVTVVPAPEPASQPAALPADLRRLIDETEQLLRAGDLDEHNRRPYSLQIAVASLEHALETAQGESFALYYLLARAKAQLQREAEARLAAEKAAALDPGSTDVRYFLGLLAQRAGDQSNALAQFRTATLSGEHEPNNPRATAAWFHLGEVLAAQGYSVAAIAAYARFDDLILEGAPEHRTAPEVARILRNRPYGALEARVELLQALGAAPRALSAIEEQRARAPDDPFLGRLYARVQIEAGLAAEALDTIRQAGREDDESLMGGLLTIALEAAERSQALDGWVARLERQVAAGAGLRFAAVVADRLREMERLALELRLRRGLAAAAPRDIAAHWELADALKRAGDLDGALRTLVQLVRAADPAARPEGADQVAPPDANLLPTAQLAAWTRSFPATDDFLALVEKYAHQPNRDFATDFVYGITAAAAGQDELAAQLLQACLDARPGFVAARVAWGRSLAARYRWDEARKQADAALQTAPDCGPAHALLADVLSALDQNEAAEAAFRRAVELLPRDAQVRLAFARHYERYGPLATDETEMRSAASAAQRRFAEALELDPTNAEAIEGLVRSYAGSGKHELARDRLAHAMRSDYPEDVLRRLRTLVRYSGQAVSEDYAAELRRQFAAHPADRRTGIDLATVLLALDHADEGLAVALRLQNLAPDDEHVITLLARAHVAHLQFSEAIALLERLVQRHPNRVSLLQALTDLCLYDFQLERARALLRRCIELQKDEDARARLENALLMTFLTFDDAAAGLPVVRSLVASRPDGDELRAVELRLMVQAGQTQEAITAATAWLDEAPDDPQRRAQFLQTCSLARAWDPAIERVRGWLQRAVDTDLEQDLVALLRAAGRPDEALKLVKARVPRGLGEDFQRRFEMAHLHRCAGRLPDAIAELEALLKQQGEPSDPRVSRARSELVQCWIQSGAYDEALQRNEEWSSADHSADVELRLNYLGRRRMILEAAGRLDEALEALRATHALTPDSAENNNLGYYLVDSGRDLDAAARMIRRAVVAEPLNESYLDSLGWALYKAGDFAAARKYVLRSVRIWTAAPSVTVLDHLGDVEYRLGDTAAARARWSEAQREFDRLLSYNITADDRRAAAGLRRKLDALERGMPAPVAPTAAEQNESR